MDILVLSDNDCKGRKKIFRVAISLNRFLFYFFNASRSSEDHILWRFFFSKLNSYIIYTQQAKPNERAVGPARRQVRDRMKECKEPPVMVKGTFPRDNSGVEMKKMNVKGRREEKPSSFTPDAIYATTGKKGRV